MGFVRENRQMTNKKLYCEDLLQILLANSDSEEEYLRFGNDDRPSNDRASPGTSLLRNGAAGHGESVHKAHTSDHFGPLPNEDGGVRGGRGLMAFFHCMIRHGTVHFWGVFHWVLYLVPDTFLVPLRSRFHANRTVTKA